MVNGHRRRWGLKIIGCHLWTFPSTNFKIGQMLPATLNFDSTSYSKAICAGHFEKCYEHSVTVRPFFGTKKLCVGHQTTVQLVFTTLQMFCMQFLQMYVCVPNPQTTLSDFNSLKSVIKKRQFNSVSTVFQKEFLHIFVCNFVKLLQFC